MEEKKKQQHSFFKELGCFMKPYKLHYISSVIISVISVVLNMLSYVFTGIIAYKLFSSSGEFAGILIYLIIAILCKISYYLLLNLSTYISHKGAYFTLRDIRTALIDKMLNLPMGYFETNGSGRLKTLICDHVEGMEKTLAHMIPELTANTLAPLCCCVLMFFVDWRLALASLIWIMLGMSVTMGMMKDYDRKYQGQINALKTMNQRVVEYVNGIEVIKNFGREEESYSKYKNDILAHAEYNVNWMRENQKFSSLGMAIAPFSLFPVIISGIIFLNNGTITASAIFMMIILTLGLFQPLMNVTNYFDQLAGMGTNAKEINDILTYPPLVRGNLTENKNNDIEFRNVDFSYNGSDKKVLDNVSFKVKEGEMFALVGESGSGKSTIAKLICGYWDKTNGDILIGDNSINDYTQEKINQMVAYVDQETFLFDKSIADNIRTGRPDASMEQVIMASVKAGCHQFITNLSNGYDTMAGECGSKLSGGERQRIAIARAIIKDAPIIVMDEATASTDPENEVLIQSAIMKAVKGKTLVVVAHRLKTIVKADKIAFVKDGKIIQTGTHDYLMENSEEYRNLYNLSEGVEI